MSPCWGNLRRHPRIHASTVHHSTTIYLASPSVYDSLPPSPSSKFLTTISSSQLLSPLPTQKRHTQLYPPSSTPNLPPSCRCKIVPSTKSPSSIRRFVRATLPSSFPLAPTHFAIAAFACYLQRPPSHVFPLFMLTVLRSSESIRFLTTSSDKRVCQRSMSCLASVPCTSSLFSSTSPPNSLSTLSVSSFRPTTL